MKKIAQLLCVSSLLASSISFAKGGIDSYIEFLQNPQLLNDQKNDPRAAEIFDLLKSIAPQIIFQTDEQFPPLDPMEFVERSSLWRANLFNSNKITPSGEVRVDALAKLGDDYFLKLEGSPKVPLKMPAVLLWEASSTKLLEKLPALPQNTKWVMIDFWYSLAFNDAAYPFALGDHQGEWEGSGYLLKLSLSASGKLQHKIVAAFYSHHESGTWYCPSELAWADAKLIGANPKLYSALGSHASYAKPGKYSRGVFGLLGTDIATGGGLVWDGSKNMRPLWLEPYFGFMGNWGGRRIVSFMSGPRVPNPKNKYFPKERDDASLAKIALMLQRCGL